MLTERTDFAIFSKPCCLIQAPNSREPDHSRRDRAARELERQRWAQYDAGYADHKW
jgi:hypothetical protein